jgi:hypothetical protein
MSCSHVRDLIDPMHLAHIRQNGVRSLGDVLRLPARGDVNVDKSLGTKHPRGSGEIA